MSARRKTLLVLVPVVILLLAAGYYLTGGHETPPNQPPLADLNGQSVQAFKQQFNSAADRTRIILLLSPT
jgi:hypothetical protein